MFTYESHLKPEKNGFYFFEITEYLQNFLGILLY